MLYRFFKGTKSKTIEVYKQDFFNQCFGLMFTTSRTRIRLFTYSTDCNVAIHSFFVFYKFLIVWLDAHNRILGSQVVTPFTPLIRPSFTFRSFLEIPIDDKYAHVIRFIVGKANI